MDDDKKKYVPFEFHNWKIYTRISQINTFVKIETGKSVNLLDTKVTFLTLHVFVTL